MEPVVRLRTFGCKLNQIESESLASAFKSAGFEIVDTGPANVYIVNTCTVTSMAEQKARREIRRFSQESPDAVIILTGCYATVSPEILSSLSPRAVCVPGDKKTIIHDFAARLITAWRSGVDLHEEAILALKQIPGVNLDSFSFSPEDFSFHSRGFLKVQDGCDNRCAYCRVCIARGPARSINPRIAVERVRVLESKGISEIVLSGVNLSQFDADGYLFPDLVLLLIAESKHVRFRISSYEPDSIGDDFLKMLENPRVCPHVHLALQSGSESVLKRMGRTCPIETVRNAVSGIRCVKSDPFIAFDMISGFPGESEAEARESIDVVEELDPAWIHSFVFSPRPGTAAFTMRPCVPERLSRERAAALTSLAVKNRDAYISRWIGRDVQGIVEIRGEKACKSPGFYFTAENYLRLLVNTGSDFGRDGLVRLRIEKNLFGDRVNAGGHDTGLGAPDALASVLAVNPRA